MCPPVPSLLTCQNICFCCPTSTTPRDKRTNMVKLETRIPAGFIGGLTALIPQVCVHYKVCVWEGGLTYHRCVHYIVCVWAGGGGTLGWAAQVTLGFWLALCCTSV